MKKLSELKNIAIACLAASSYHRAIDYKSVVKLKKMAQDIEGLINHEVGDRIEQSKKITDEVSNRIAAKYQEECKQNPDNVKDINFRFQAAIMSDPEVQNIQSLIWGHECDYEFEQIIIPDKDYTESFPDETRKVVLFDVEYEVSGLLGLQDLDLKGVIKIQE